VVVVLPASMWAIMPMFRMVCSMGYLTAKPQGMAMFAMSLDLGIPA